MASMWVEALGAETRYYDVGGIRTRTIEAGSGPAVIFLHGSGGHAEAFIRNIVPLAQGRHIISMDYLGSGLTGYTEGPPTLKQRVDHIIGLMDAMGIETACLAGESFGGTLAFAAARAYPERVSSLVTIVGGAFDFGGDETSAEQWRNAMKTVVTRQRDFLANPSRETVRQRLAWLFHKPERDISEELVDVRWAFYQREPVRRGVSDLCDMITEDVAARAGGPEVHAKRTDAFKPMKPEDLRSVPQPTLFIWTDHNPSTTAVIAEMAANFMPNARFELMEDCGHWPQWEHPAEFNAIMDKFLTEQTAFEEAAE